MIFPPEKEHGQEKIIEKEKMPFVGI